MRSRNLLNDRRRKNVNRILIIAACALAGLFVAWLLPGPLTLLAALAGIIVGVGAGIIAASFLIARSRGENPKEVVKEVVRQAVQPDPGAEERPIHEQLIRTNQALRLNASLSPVVLDSFERLIDLIRLVAPEAIDKAPDSETTFDLMRLGKTHLPELAGKFLALSAADQQGAQDKLLGQLQKLAEVVEKAQRALDESRLADFEAQHGFLEVKFGA
jgi:hypothetical protein